MNELPTDLLIEKLDHYEPGPSSYTTLGVYGDGFIRRFGKRSIEHVNPEILDEVSRDLQRAASMLIQEDIPPLAINEYVLGPRRVFFDFDEIDFSPEFARAFAFGLGQVLRMHFSGHTSSIVLVGKNGKGNYHFHLPGTLVVNWQIERRILQLATELYESRPKADFMPNNQGHLRLHRTSKGNPNDVYGFFCAFDNSGREIDHAQIDQQWWSIRPSSEQLRQFILDPKKRSVYISSPIAIRTKDGKSDEDREPSLLNWAETSSMVFRGTVLNGGCEYSAVLPPPSCEIVQSDDAKMDHVWNRVTGTTDNVISSFSRAWAVMKVRSDNQGNCSDSCPGAQLSMLCRTYAGDRAVIYRTVACAACGLLRALSPWEPYRGFEATLVNDSGRYQKIAAVRPFVQPVAPINPKTLLDIPLESLFYPKGLPANDDFRRVFPWQDIPKCKEYLTKWLCNFQGTPLGGFDRIIEEEPRVVRSSDCITARGDYAGKVFMPLRFPVSASNANGSETLIRIYEAPCDSGKTNLAIWTALKRRIDGKVLIIAPRTQLCASFVEKVRRIVEHWDRDQASIARDNDHYSPLQPLCGDVVVRSHIESTPEELFESDVAVCTMESFQRYLGHREAYKPKVVVMDEAQTTIESLFLSPYVGNRKQCIQSVIRVMALSRLVCLLDKDVTPLCGLFVSLIAASKKKALQHLDEGLMDRVCTVRFQTYKLVDEVKRKVRLVKYVGRCIQLIAEEIKEGRRVIVFETGNARARALLLYLEKTTDKKGFLLVGDSKKEVKEQFSRDPARYLIENEIDFFIHTSTIDVGISIEHPGGYFHSAYVIDRARTVTWRSCTQGSARARELIGTDQGTREITVCQVGIMPHRKSGEQRQVPTLGSAYWAQFANLADSQRNVEPRSYLYRMIPFSDKVRLKEGDPIVVLEIATIASRELEGELHYNIYQSWVKDENIEEVFDDHKAYGGDQRARAEIKSYQESYQESQEIERLENLAREDHVIEDQDDRQKRKWIDAIGAPLELDRNEDFMAYAKKEGTTELWNLYGYYTLVEHIHGDIPALDRLEKLRLDLTVEDGAAHGLDKNGIGLASEVLLAAGCIKWLGMDKWLTGEEDGLASNKTTALVDDGSLVALPWAPYERKNMNDWFTEVGRRRIGKGKTSIRAIITGENKNRYLNCRRTFLRESDPFKKLTLQLSFARHVVKGFVGKVMTAGKSPVVQASAIKKRLSLMKGFCDSFGIDEEGHYKMPYPRVIRHMEEHINLQPLPNWGYEEEGDDLEFIVED